MKRYPEYKESGVEWIGKIPKHWKILPFMHWLKKVKTKKKTSIPKMDYQESGKFPIIDQGASFIAGWTDLTDSVISDNLPVVIFGDHTRIFKYVDFPFTLGADGTQLLYPNDDILNPRFFYYALLNLKIPNEGYSRHYRYLRKFSVACPALPTQRKIANFLDRKTEQIDELIHIKARQIELLQEHRTTLINQAVTKGLDPNVEMKPSEVEWIGEIPAHWKIEKIKHVATLVSEKSTPETDAIKISPENVESKTGKVLDFYSSYDSSGVKFQVGDVLFNKIRVYLNKVVFAEYDGYSLGEMIVMRPSLQGMGKYLFYLMLSSRFIEYCDSLSYGAKMPRTAVDDILNAQIPITSDKEQRQIVNFLEGKTKQIDELITAEQRKIELLKEYRQSLISEAVTGKIDVRGEV